jgi:hypothetical protein
MIVQDKDGSMYFAIYSEEVTNQVSEFQNQIKRINENIEQKYGNELRRLYEEDYIAYESLRDVAETEMNELVEEIRVEFSNLFMNVQPIRRIPLGEVFFAEGIH